VTDRPLTVSGAVRITRLDADGNPIGEPQVITSAGIAVEAGYSYGVDATICPAPEPYTMSAVDGDVVLVVKSQGRSHSIPLGFATIPGRIPFSEARSQLAGELRRIAGLVEQGIPGIWTSGQ